MLEQCHNNYFAAKRLYREIYSEQRHPILIIKKSLLSELDKDIFEKRDELKAQKILHLWLLCY